MNGSRPWIAAAGFLTLIVPAARGQAVAFFPNVGSFQNGVVMSATPVVSHDRRYVRLGMLPQFTALEGFDTFQVPAAVSGVGAGGVGFGGGGGAGGLMGFAGMNGPIDGPVPQGSLPQQEGWDARRNSGGSSDFEDQLRPDASPPKRVAARPAPAAKTRRKVGAAAKAKAGRTAGPTRPATGGGRRR